MIAAGLGAAVDPERLLWTPRTMITVPAMPMQLTLVDWARRLDPAGSVPRLVALLSEANELLFDDPVFWQRRPGDAASEFRGIPVRYTYVGDGQRERLLPLKVNANG